VEKKSEETRYTSQIRQDTFSLDGGQAVEYLRPPFLPKEWSAMHSALEYSSVYSQASGFFPMIGNVLIDTAWNISKPALIFGCIALVIMYIAYTALCLTWCCLCCGQPKRGYAYVERGVGAPIRSRKVSYNYGAFR